MGPNSRNGGSDPGSLFVFPSPKVGDGKTGKEEGCFETSRNIRRGLET